jgi:hypothetical protein
MQAAPAQPNLIELKKSRESEAAFIAPTVGRLAK